MPTTSSTNWKKIFLVAAATGTATAILAGAGVWDPSSPRYWRETAQTALFASAHRAPAKYTAKITRMALKVHPEGAVYSEIEDAAKLFEQSGEMESAAALWLGLAQFDAASQHLDQAERHAILARNANVSERAYITGLLITRGSTQKRNQWLAGLQTHYPAHELARAFSCIERLQSFEDGPPQECSSADWIGTRAQAGRDEYFRIQQEIEGLPQAAAAQIQDNERALVSLAVVQPPLVARYRDAVAQLADLEKNGKWRAAGIGLANAIFPLPQPGDTFETWITRESICAFPLIRWLCRASALTDAFAKLQREREQLTQTRDRIADEWRRNESAIATCQSTIAYWRSEEPLLRLARAREALLPRFRTDVEQTAFAHFTEIGFKSSEALAIAMRTPAERQFPARAGSVTVQAASHN